jgi:chromate transporter
MINSSPHPVPSRKEAFIFWTKLGFISFGGPAGQISIMYDYLVDKKKWISDSRFLNALNYCMVLPGPEAQQLATYTGWLMHGRVGGLVAGILFILPSIFILLGLSIVYVVYGTLPWVNAIFNGLKPAVIAIVILALIKIGKKSLLSSFHYLIAIGSFVGIFFFNIPFPLIIIIAILSALLIKKFYPAALQANKNKAGHSGKSDSGEHGFSINKHTPLSGEAPDMFRITRQILVVLVLWLIPFALFYFYSTDFAFWKNLSSFFTKAALVTFGGAYAVLPYVAQYSVEKLQWLSSLQMIDGLALGETTPGPLVMVLAFVGFMAGYNHFGFSLYAASLGLFAAVFYTFLPCFFFILVGAPIIERTQHNKFIQDALSIVTAAVVGVVLNLTIYLCKAVLIPDGSQDIAEFNWPALLWVAVSFIAMYRFKIGIITWIGISAVFGCALLLLS